MTPATDYRVTAEAVAGALVRFHPSTGPGYDAACVVVRDWGRLWWRWWLLRRPVAVVKGYVGGATLSHGRSLDDWLRGVGFRRLRYERRRGDRVTWHERRL